MSSDPAIIGVAGSCQGQRFPISAAGLRIGREQGNQVVLDDTGVSRRHARLVLHKGALWVQDLGSHNGVWVNGVRVRGHRQLGVGDRVQIGRTVFQVAAERQAPAPTPGGWVRRMLLSIPVLAGCALLLLVTARAKGPQPAGEEPAEPSVLRQALLEPAVPVPGLEALSGSEPAATLPEPPLGSSSASLLEQAHAFYDAGRLADAKLRHRQALALDEGCEVCRSRIDRLNARITEDIARQLDAGTRYLDELRIEEAIAAWQVVLMLEPDPSSRSHRQAKENIEEARARAHECRMPVSASM